MQDLTPPEAMAAALARHNQGEPLETSWTSGQVVERAGVTFVGSMGFPDFKHPMLRLPVEWYDRRSATNDANFIDLKAGWVKYTTAMQRAFFERLDQAFDRQTKDIVVATHYPILDLQSRLNPNDVETWPYFFNWTIGQQVLKLAQQHPDKRVLCVAGHSHEYCTGVLKQAAENVWGYGAQGQYGRIALWLFDTELWQFIERVKSKRGPYRQAIGDEDGE